MRSELLNDESLAKRPESYPIRPWLGFPEPDEYPRASDGRHVCWLGLRWWPMGNTRWMMNGWDCRPGSCLHPIDVRLFNAITRQYNQGWQYGGMTLIKAVLITNSTTGNCIYALPVLSLSVICGALPSPIERSRLGVSPTTTRATKCGGWIGRLKASRVEDQEFESSRSNPFNDLHNWYLSLRSLVLGIVRLEQRLVMSVLR